ncbi:MAG: radical SAM protein [Endomicrobium sp.]|jgi:MoaA/NifB/PqqE/SkfB family radical SAM enzyme|nr:radical SAM protein [Endomicrobium sp.]
MIIRAKTKDLFEGKSISEKQRQNSELNLFELESGKTELKSYPRRIVLELTNACNLNCVMCGRNAADFSLTQLSMENFYALEPLFDTVEEVTLMGWGEPTSHPNFEGMLKILDNHSVRKYFCTNGMRLNKIKDAIFNYNIDVFAVSVDGATQETNNKIRRGSDILKINSYLKEIVLEKTRKNLKYPHINYVFCAMKQNLDELPDLINMAADVGLDEVKVVFLTAFDQRLVNQTLYGEEEKVREVFKKTEERAQKHKILLKLPYIAGSDPAENALHRDCFVAYRDFYLGSDGYVRPCMSTSQKFFKFDKYCKFFDMWNAGEFKKHRMIVNTPNMPNSCKNCYQSSHCNWNNKKSYNQIEEDFAPEWKR